MTTARDIMSEQVASISPATTVLEAAQTMRQNRVGALPVVDDRNHLMGIVTDRDIVVNAIANGAGPDSTIETYGVRDVFTVAPDATLEEVQVIMGDNQVRRLPVVDGEEIIGIISLADVAKAGAAEEVGTTTERISA
jgi:CBS domain-containing protein